jgi:hypothetical protein
MKRMYRPKLFLEPALKPSKNGWIDRYRAAAAFADWCFEYATSLANLFSYQKDATPTRLDAAVRHALKNGSR